MVLKEQALTHTCFASCAGMIWVHEKEPAMVQMEGMVGTYQHKALLTPVLAGRKQLGLLDRISQPLLGLGIV